jgi:hypothetical protein
MVTDRRSESIISLKLSGLHIKHFQPWQVSVSNEPVKILKQHSNSIRTEANPYCNESPFSPGQKTLVYLSTVLFISDDINTINYLCFFFYSRLASMSI